MTEAAHNTEGALNSATPTPPQNASSATSPADRMTPTRAGDVSGWAGWVVFAGVILIVVGFFQVIQGLVAIFDEGYYLVGPEGLVINVDYTTWGWVHLVLGVVAVLTGLGLLAGNTVARVVAVVLAVLSAILNLAFIAAYPLWSTIVIALDVIVIYAIVVHGRELQNYR